MIILFALALNLITTGQQIDTSAQGTEMLHAASCTGQPLNPRTSPRPMPRPKGL